MTTGSDIDVILASGSPRRRELLTLIGVAHTVIPANIDETLLAGETPEGHVERLARDKANAVAAGRESALVIAADTVVVRDGVVMGKPRGAAEAEAALATLAGRSHIVLTGMACATNGRLVSSVERVTVKFRDLSAEEIREYVATGEPLDKAGSYGIQGKGATIVERIDGDYFAVMGLSLVRLVDMMQRLGVRYRFGGAPLLT